MTISNIKTVATAWVAILALGFVLLPGTATAEASSGSGEAASAWQRIVTGVSDFVQSVKGWLVESNSAGSGTGVDTNAAGEGTGESTRGVGNGTGVGTRSAGSGTGQEERGASEGIRVGTRSAGSGTG